MDHTPSIQAIVQPLLDWYRRCARQLPWRSQPAPYRVWVSEIMLQQTRVEAVKPYYERFLEAFPTVEALAAADEERLLKLWEGLGYYSRARNLQKAARQVCRDHDGTIPGSFEKLRALPGVGDYTAGAIASIAFGVAVPCVDGNVLRVFARLRADDADIALPAVKEALRRELLDHMPRQAPGDFNQALMELGATVCLPGGVPLCSSCPLEGLCQARAKGLEQALPVKSKPKARAVARRTILAILHDGRVALHRRAQGPLKGMWELPGAEGELDVLQAAAVAEEWGFSVRTGSGLPPARHVFTHREWQMTGWLMEAAGPTLPGEDWVWAGRRELAEFYALPAAFRTQGRAVEQHLK